MGFFETVCQLCGVSFGILLLRRPDEPSEASWDYTGSDHVDEDEELSELCGESSGCQLLPHDGSETGGAHGRIRLYLNPWVQCTADLIGGDEGMSSGAMSGEKGL